MMMKSVWIVLLLLGILYRCSAENSVCAGLSTIECLKILGQPPIGKRTETAKSLNLTPNLDWLWRRDQANQPMCTLWDIYSSITEDCQVELLEVLHFFVTHSDY